MALVELGTRIKLNKIAISDFDMINNNSWFIH